MIVDDDTAAFATCHRQTRARLRDLMLGGHQAYENERDLLAKLRAFAPDIARIAINEEAFVERTWRYAVGLSGIQQVVHCGAPLVSGHPPHTAAWEQHALREDGPVVYVEPDHLLAVTGQVDLGDRDVHVVQVDPLDIDALVDAIGYRIDWKEPVAVIAPSVLHFLSEESAKSWTSALAERMAPRSLLIATHFLDPETDSTVELIERLLQVLDWSTFGPSFVRRRAAIEQLVPAFTMVPPGVSPAQAWYPNGPQLRPETPCDRLLAGFVAMVPRSP